MKTRWPRILHPPDARDYVGGRTNLEYLEKYQDLKPLKRSKRNTIYDATHIDVALDRAYLCGWEIPK